MGATGTTKDNRINLKRSFKCDQNNLGPYYKTKQVYLFRMNPKFDRKAIVKMPHSLT